MLSPFYIILCFTFFCFAFHDHFFHLVADEIVNVSRGQPFPRTKLAHFCAHIDVIPAFEIGFELNISRLELMVQRNARISQLLVDLLLHEIKLQRNSYYIKKHQYRSCTFN
jgi:hypothetical protein